MYINTCASCTCHAMMCVCVCVCVCSGVCSCTQCSGTSAFVREYDPIRPNDPHPPSKHSSQAVAEPKTHGLAARNAHPSSSVDHTRNCGEALH